MATAPTVQDCSVGAAPVDPVHEALLGAAARVRSLAQSAEAWAKHEITCGADDSAARATRHAHMMLAYRLAAAEIDMLARVHELEVK